MILTKEKMNSYECIALGNGEKLERFGDIIVRRPDPQCMWPIENKALWSDVHAYYHRSDKGGGYWENLKKIKDFWYIDYKDLKFKISLTNFKHTGLFPEQAINWEFIDKQIRESNKEDIKILNLFAYTGAATIVASNAGASEVVHIDSSKGMISWAKDNMSINNLENNNIRFIQDDCLKFVERENRRGRKYDGIILDPPSYGRGPDGELWKVEDHLYTLLSSCKEILSDEPLFLIVSCYASTITPLLLKNVLSKVFKNVDKFNIETFELGIAVTSDDIILPCGITGRINLK